MLHGFLRQLKFILKTLGPLGPPSRIFVDLCEIKALGVPGIDGKAYALSCSHRTREHDAFTRAHMDPEIYKYCCCLLKCSDTPAET